MKRWQDLRSGSRLTKRNNKEAGTIEFAGNKSVITPEGVFIIGTYDENGIPNAMKAAWGITKQRNGESDTICNRQPFHIRPDLVN